MNTNNPSSLERELADLRDRMAELESALSHGDKPAARWEPTGFYADYYATAGFFLGMFAALTSLAVNIIGSSIFDQHPLQLIQVYLTFPLGEEALTMDSGGTLAIGCCLYIGTGMLLGIVFQLALAALAPQPGALVKRLVIASVLAIGIWLFAFYGILNWLQPLLFGGNWIVEQVPAYVGLITHLVFGWTMALLFSFGVYRARANGNAAAGGLSEF